MTNPFHDLLFGRRPGDGDPFLRLVAAPASPRNTVTGVQKNIIREHFKEALHAV